MKIIIAWSLILLSLVMWYYVENTTADLASRRIVHAIAAVFAVVGMVLGFIGTVESIKRRSK